MSQGNRSQRLHEVDRLRVLAVLPGPWNMPVFMFLAGCSAWFARRGRGDLHVVRARLARLLVPLGVGTLLLVPVQMYYFPLFRGEFEGSYLAFCPRSFDGLYPEENLNHGPL